MTPHVPASKPALGNRIAPWRFLLFAFIFVAAGCLLCPWLGVAQGIMGAFDLGAIAFLIACVPLFNDTASQMRQTALNNDANRGGLLLIIATVTVVVLASVASELSQRAKPHRPILILVSVTLGLCWIFSNLVYALHYAHLFYLQDKTGKDAGGLSFPSTEEPDYWDFAYYASCLGMTFQTSDVEIHTSIQRRTTMFHCFGAFVFNLGVIAFTINILGSS